MEINNWIIDNCGYGVDIYYKCCLFVNLHVTTNIKTAHARNVFQIAIRPNHADFLKDLISFAE